MRYCSSAGAAWLADEQETWFPDRYSLNYVKRQLLALNLHLHRHAALRFGRGFVCGLH